MLHDKMRYLALDGLRGIAAFLVVIHHFPDFLGGWSPTLTASVVDFFFVLSGFVLSSAYSSSIALGNSFWKLTKVRLIRLYPLYIIGTTIFVASLLGSLVSRGYISDFHVAFWLAIPFAILIIPAPGFGVSENIFPLNSPAWSLFCELIVNLIWFRLGEKVSERVLIALILFGGAGLIYFRGDLSGGWSRENYHVGLFRVFYGFFCGVLLFKIKDMFPQWLTAPAQVLFVFFIVIATVTPKELWLFVVLVIYPLIVIIGSRVSVYGWWESCCEFFGRISYPIYAIHAPLGAALVPFLKAFGFTSIAFITVAYVIMLLGLSVFLEQYYDRPIRRLLT